MRVNVLNPGRTRTAMRRQAYPAEDLETLPLPESIAGAVSGPAGPGEPRRHRPQFRCSGRWRRGLSRGRKRGQLLLSQLAKLTAPEGAFEPRGPRLRAHHATDEGTLALE